MKKLKRFFAILGIIFSLLQITEKTNEQGQVATLSETSMSYPDEKEEEIIQPYSLQQNPISF